MQVIAHRGFAGLRVENTLVAFAHAIECGAAGAELDVHLSRDGQVVVHHDDCLNPSYCRHADGDWITPSEALPLAQLTYAQMQVFDIGVPRPDSAYARHFNRIVPTPGQRIPLLREVIALARARSDDFFLVIEIKASPLDAARESWRALVDAVLAIVDAEAFHERTVLCSFDWGSLRAARERCPALPAWMTTAPQSWFAPERPPASDIPPGAAELARWRAASAGGSAPWYAGFDPAGYGGSPVRAVAAAGGAAWFPFHRDFTAARARESAGAGLVTAAWSVNLRDPAEIARLREAGLACLVMDYPLAEI